MKTPWAVLTAAGLAMVSANPAWSQSSGRDDGILAGSFLLKPSLEVGARYDDNIAQEDRGQEETDIIMSVAPTLKAESTWRRHSLKIDSGITADRYLDNTADNSLDARFVTNGRIDVTRATKIDTIVSYRRGHDNRGDDNTGVQAEPTKFDRYRGEVIVRSRPNRLSVSGGGGVLYANFHDADAVNNDDDRDVINYHGRARVAYGVQRHIDAFVTGRVDRFDYVDAVDDAGFDRDSTGYAVRAGLAYFPSAQLRVSAAAGYLMRTFDDPGLGDVDGIDFSGSVNWELPNRLTNINLTAGRSVSESQDADASARLVTSFSAKVTHDLARTWELEGRARYANLQDEGGAGATDDDDYSAGASIDYVFHPRVKLGATYDYKHRSSSDAGEDYSQNVFGVRLRIGFLD
ncbi:MAG: outer membrane beta-barrel protein [Minwuia sp.]|uniref:outer membrane beta-barrel protein n=1 Tax=Minwuia sp. TaxID=2493630 RepID=UPI003A83E376